VQDFDPFIGNRPLSFWLFALLISLPFGFLRLRRIKKRRDTNPFKGMNPTHSAITCPRCREPWPGGYEPHSHREYMWKGVKCPACGCEYDERGHERK